MKIYEKSILELLKNETLNKTYRVTNKYVDSDPCFLERYRFFSNTEQHHRYFLTKKIFKLIEANYDITLNNIRDKNLLFKLDYIIDILSHEMISINITYYLIDHYFWFLLHDNSYSNGHYSNRKIIQKVDSRIYQGGFGISSQWLNLFNNFTYFSKDMTISSKEIITYLNVLKKLIIQSEKKYFRDFKVNAASCLINKSCPYQVNDNLFNNFTKYEIIKTLESIIDNKLYHKQSTLNTNPSICIKNAVESYENNKKLLLNILDS